MAESRPAAKEEELRARRNAVDMEYPQDVVRTRIVPKGDLGRERLVEAKAVVALILRDVGRPACWHLQGLAGCRTVSRPPGTVRFGGQMRVIRNHG